MGSRFEASFKKPNITVVTILNQCFYESRFNEL